MIWLVCISIGLFIIGIVSCITYVIADLDDAYLFIGGALIITSIISLIVLLMVNTTQVEKSTSLEFPASEYTLSHKVTEFEGQIDTTYVLIPKEE